MFVNPVLMLSSINPVSEKTAPSPGDMEVGARSDHVHPRLTSATMHNLGETGEATVTFTRPFAGLPAVTCLLYEATNSQPVVFKVKDWVRNGDAYTGCTIQGFRASLLPALSGVLLIGPLITALANYNVFGGSAAGAQFCCIALHPSN